MFIMWLNMVVIMDIRGMNRKLIYVKSKFTSYSDRLCFSIVDLTRARLAAEVATMSFCMSLYKSAYLWYGYHTASPFGISLNASSHAAVRSQVRISLILNEWIFVCSLVSSFLMRKLAWLLIRSPTNISWIISKRAIWYFSRQTFTLLYYYVVTWHQLELWNNACL